LLFRIIILIDPAPKKIKTTPHRENSGIATIVEGLALFSVSLGFAVGLEIVFVGLDV
jgi:hypothetical protein